MWPKHGKTHFIYFLLYFIKPSLSDEENEDEGVNRSSSMLACLKQIALISPICEKRAIALLFQAVKEQFLDKDLVKKVKRPYIVHNNVLTHFTL